MTRKTTNRLVQTSSYNLGIPIRIVRRNFSLVLGLRDLVESKWAQWMARVQVLYEVEQAHAVIPVRARLEHLREKVAAGFVDYAMTKYMSSNLKFNRIVFQFFEQKLLSRIKSKINSLRRKHSDSMNMFRGKLGFIYWSMQFVFCLPSESSSKYFSACARSDPLQVGAEPCSWAGAWQVSNFSR